MQGQGAKCVFVLSAGDKANTVVLHPSSAANCRMLEGVFDVLLGVNLDFAFMFIVFILFIYNFIVTAQLNLNSSWE